MCEHYAMRQQGLDWQVWIRKGQDALPCKLVLTKMSDPAMPQFSAVYSWSDTAAAGGRGLYAIRRLRAPSRSAWASYGPHRSTGEIEMMKPLHLLG